MEKVYLLLRNNIESGPFTIQELLVQQLKPTDMIWVEGKSTAWTYLSEMELNFHTEETTSEVANLPITRKYGDEIEQKAEEIRKRALSYKPKPLMIPTDPASDLSNYSRSFVSPDDSIEIINHKKERNKTLNEVIMTSVIICLFAGGLYAGSNFLHTRKEIISPAATRVTTPKKTVPSRKDNNIQPVQDISGPVALALSDSTQEQTATNVSVKPKTNHSSLVVKQSPDTTTRKIIPVQPLTVDVKDNESSTAVKLPIADTYAEPVEKKEESSKKEEVVKKNSSETTKKTVNKNEKTEETEDDKKKGLGEALKGIFKKKKKDEKKD